MPVPVRRPGSGGRSGRGVFRQPPGAISIAPKDGEEGLVELLLAGPPVTRVDRVRMLGVPARGGRDHVADDRPALRIRTIVRWAAVEGPSVVECGTAGPDLDRDQLEVHAGWNQAADVPQP